MSRYSHRCAAPGCGKVVPGDVLMCYPHWRAVPAREQRAVSRSWRAFSADPYDQAARDAYNAARAAAIAALPAEAPKEPT